MKTTYFIKNLKLIERNYQWLNSSARITDKIIYYPAISASYLRMARGQKQVKYLGKSFYYDNPATPLNLQTYPYEISQKILKNLKTKPKTILDIGGNIGQFSSTMLYFLEDKVKIDIFEPNGDIFPILKKNLYPSTAIRLYNYGLSGDNGGRESTKLYYEKNRSGTGSFHASNAGVGSLQGIDVKITNDVYKVTRKKNYDLVKVDVEGYEIEVLGALANVKTKYLFIEVSGPGRQRGYVDSVLLNKISKTLGDFQILYSTGSKKNSITYELLLEFI